MKSTFLSHKHAKPLFSEPASRFGAWVRLLIHCSEHENSGRLNDLDDWPEARLQRLLGYGGRSLLSEMVEADMVRRDPEGGYLVMGYEIEQESAYLKRGAGLAKGRQQIAENADAKKVRALTLDNVIAMRPKRSPDKRREDPSMGSLSLGEQGDRD